MECWVNHAACSRTPCTMIWPAIGVETGVPKSRTGVIDSLKAIKLVTGRKECSNLYKNLVGSCRELL